MKTAVIVVVMVVVFNALFVFLGGLDFLVKVGLREETVVHVDPTIVDVFRFTLQEEVQKKIGIPEDGYEPHMFLTAFPGLVATDFAGVEASSGVYAVENGKLSLKFDETQLEHSAIGAITRGGIATLLNNIAKRIGIDLNADGTITDVMEAITSK